MGPIFPSVEEGLQVNATVKWKLLSAASEKGNVIGADSPNSKHIKILHIVICKLSYNRSHLKYNIHFFMLVLRF